jgi:hypothetical protein
MPVMKADAIKPGDGTIEEMNPAVVNTPFHLPEDKQKPAASATSLRKSSSPLTYWVFYPFVML